MKGLMSGTTGLVGVLAATLWVASSTLAADTTPSGDVRGQIENVKSILSAVEMKLGSIAKSIEQADKDADEIIAQARTGTDSRKVAAELRRLNAVLDDADAGTMAAADTLAEVGTVLGRLKANPTVRSSKSLSMQVEILFDSVAELEKAVQKADEASAAVRSKLRKIATLARS